MTFTITLRKNDKILTFSSTKWDVLFNFDVLWYTESNIRAPVLLNLFDKLQKRDKMQGLNCIGKPRVLSLFLNSFDKFNKTWAPM